MSKKAKVNRVAIVGPIVSGTSFYSYWYGCYITGSDTVIGSLGTSGDVEIFVNSPGGSVFAGFDIVNAINSVIESGRKVTFYISAMSASIASYITTASKGAKVVMSDNGKLMFHAPWTVIIGSKDELRDEADLLEQMETDIKKAVKSRGATSEDSWFEAGRAKWISAEESKAMGLIDAIGNPPIDLIIAVKGLDKKPISGGDSEYAMKDNKEGGKEDGRSTKKCSDGSRSDLDIFRKQVDKIAASTMMNGVLEDICSQQFGEKCTVTDVADGSFRLTRENGDKSLLKFSPDPLTIVSVDWESIASFEELKGSDTTNGEDDMSEKNKNLNTDDGNEPVATEPVNTEPVVENPVATEPVATEPVNTEPVATEPTTVGDPEGFVEGQDNSGAVPLNGLELNGPAVTPSTADLAADLTEDMVAFAKERYNQTRNSLIAKIKGCSASKFTDTELNSFKLNMLENIANIVDFAESAQAKSTEVGDGKADNSIVAVKQDKGQVATLPPPSY